MTTTSPSGENWQSLGQATTNTTPGSQHKQQVECKHLWSLSQEHSLAAVSFKDPHGIHLLLADPELRAQRIAGAYAKLYFDSKAASKGRFQLYWVALAAFVVKDIYYAFRYAREEVLSGGWFNSFADSVGDAYTHAMRTYLALAKGNIWLFMDIHPWMQFILDFALKEDGSVDEATLKSCPPERNWSTYDDDARIAIQWLPFGSDWLGRCKQFVEVDPTYAKRHANKLDDQGVKSEVGHEKPSPFRLPLNYYWSHFAGAGSVIEAYHSEMLHSCNDSDAIGRLEKIRNFKVTQEISDGYSAIMGQSSASDLKNKQKFQNKELIAIAKHEQLNVLQPLIYDDPYLQMTMKTNRVISKYSFGVFAPAFALYFSAAKQSNDKIQFEGNIFTDPVERMDFVGKIASKFDNLMRNKPSYMESELKKILDWAGNA